MFVQVFCLTIVVSSTKRKDGHGTLQIGGSGAGLLLCLTDEGRNGVLLKINKKRNMKCKAY
jgi:hypothetical protein